MQIQSFATDVLYRLLLDLTEPLYESASENDDFVRFEASQEVYDAAVNVRFSQTYCTASSQLLRILTKYYFIVW